MSDLLKEWKKLAREIVKYDKLYEQGIPLITDNLYDTLYARLEEIEEIIGPQKNSPISRIVSNSLVNKVKHITPVLSLEHGFGIESLEGFLKRFPEQDVFPMVGEHKIDGVSVMLRYENGELIKGITRGNGEYGTDITRQIRLLDVPSNIPDLGLLEVRGELYITNDEFSKVSDQFSSPRNACASIVQNKSSSLDLKLGFLAHNFIQFESKHVYYSEMMDYVRQLGFQVVQNRLLGNFEECAAFFSDIVQNRSIIPYSIDGVVFKINLLSKWSELGNNRKSPRYAFAVKFDPISKETVIKDICFQVGKFGTITPVAIFDTITIDGQNISKATLHNIDGVRENNYGPGDRIIVSRSGDTIPYIKAKVYDANSPVDIIHCPSCGSVLVPCKKSLKCNQSWACRAQRIEKIEHFCSRNAFNIDGVGPKGIESLVDLGLIYYPSDIFDLPEMIRSRKIDLSTVENWNSKSIQNFINSVDNARRIKLGNFLYAICIPNVGLGHSKTLATHFATFNDLVQVCHTGELPAIAGIGPAIRQSICDFVNDPKEKWIYSIEGIEITN